MPHTANTILYKQAAERLRQEKETFEQQKQQDNLWFYLRLLMGLVSVVLLPGLFFVSAKVLLNPQQYSAKTLNIVCCVLLADVLGLVASIWKVVLSRGSNTKLNPVTAKVLIVDQSSPPQSEENPMIEIH
jgi:uncharacterized membrane protein YqjE